MGKNLLVIHGGGPTAVMNSSLFGAVTEAQKSNAVLRIYGARNGTGGVLREAFVELSEEPLKRLELLLRTPGSAIGTSRDPLQQEDYIKMAKILERNQIAYVLFNGGNGTMDTCGKLYEVCKERGFDINIVGIPKTMDNDIAVTDHSPGYGSAARYFAQSVREVCMDVKSLPIHVVVIEASGRNAGWVAAASAMASENGEEGPDLIYLPERPFDEEQYISDVRALLKNKKGIVIVVSEGLRNREGTPIVEPVFKNERSVYFGDVSAYLANLVIQRLGYKARSEKPGLLARASIELQSSVDQREAKMAGQMACRAALAGESGKMVAFRRISTLPYKVEPFLVGIKEVMLYERTMPDSYINEKGNGVTKAFRDWCRPLLGDSFPEMISFL